MKPTILSQRIRLSLVIFAVLITCFCFSAQAQDNVLIVSAASFQPLDIAPESIVSAFGTNLATTTATATDTDPGTPGIQLPTTLGGIRIRVGGLPAELLFVSPRQINFLIPAAVLPGGSVLPESTSITVEIFRNDGTILYSFVTVRPVSPALFSFFGTGRGTPAATILRIKADGTQIMESVVERDGTGVLIPRAIDPGPPGERIFLSLYLSGLRRAPDLNGDGNLNESVRVLLSGYAITPAFAGRQPDFAGLDQINVEIPRELAGRSRLKIAVIVNEETPSNETEVPFAIPPINAVEWRTAGLSNTRLNAVLATDTSLLAGTDTGIQRSPDNGATWFAVQYGLPGNRQTLALSDQTMFEGFLLAGTNGSGVWYSGDDGRIWNADHSPSNSALLNQKIPALGATEKWAYSGTDGIGVYRLRRFFNGASWQRSGTGTETQRISALSAAGAIVFAGTRDGKILRSSDEGVTWSNASTGLPASIEVRSLVQFKTTAFAGTTSGLYRSTDSGASWNAVTQGLPTNTAVNALLVYGSNILAGTGSGVYLSKDSGTTWQAINTGLTNQEVLSLTAFDARLVAGTTSGAFVASLVISPNRIPLAIAQNVTMDEDTAKSFTLFSSDADGDALTYHIGRPPQNGTLRINGANVTYSPNPDFSGQDQFTFRVFDGKISSLPATVTLTVNPINDAPQMDIDSPRVALVGDFLRITIRATDPETKPGEQPLKLTTTGLPEGAKADELPSQGLYQFTWVPAAPGTYTINFTVTDADTPPLSSSQAITIRVADNPEKGAWSKVQLPPGNAELQKLFVDRNDLYISTYDTSGANPVTNFYRSTDNGASWVSINQGLTDLVKTLVRSGNALFAGTSSGMFRLASTSASWTAVNNGLPEGSRNIVASVARDNKIVITTFTEIWLSTNQGESWTNINGNLPAQQINRANLLITSVTFVGDALFTSLYRALPVVLPARNQPEQIITENPFSDAQAVIEDEALQADFEATIYRSTDNGASWLPVVSGLPFQASFFSNARPGSIDIDSLVTAGTTLYATSASRVFRSTNQGARWQQLPVPSRPPLTPTGVNGAGGNNSFAPFFQPSATPLVIANGYIYTSNGNGVIVSREDGADWLPINIGLNSSIVPQLATNGSRLYVVTQILSLSLPGNIRQLFVRNLLQP